MIPLKFSTASQEIPLGYFVDSTDGDTEETGLTIANTDIKLWKNGATTLANKNSGGATHISNGIYYATLDATDTNTYGPMVVFVHVSGALTVRLECVVMEANAFDSMYAALGTGYIEADARLISGDATAANNLEADYDGTGYNKSNSTIGTCTTNTDMRGTDSALLAASAPTNFVDLAITVTTGEVTVGTNNDKTGYTVSTVSDKTGYSLAASQTFNVTGNITGNLSGSVGSVTGNVGGNVVGSVASVTGAVGSVTGAVGSVTGNVGGNVVGSAASVTGNVGGNVAGSVGSVVGHTPQTGDNFTRLGAPAGVSVSADIAAIKAETANIDTLAVKKNAAFSNFGFIMVLTSDHVTPATGLTVTGQRSIDGGAFASVSGTITEISNGAYQFDALAADTNGDSIIWRFSSATADDVFVSFITTP